MDLVGASASEQRTSIVPRDRAALVASEPNDAPAARLVEMWVRLSITNWMNRFPGRNRSHDTYIGLLVWDLLGAVLAYTEWNDLVIVLTGGEVISNVFTMTLHQCIQQSQQIHNHIGVLLRDASSVYVAADALKAWFEALLADWVDKVAVGRLRWMVAPEVDTRGMVRWQGQVS